MTLSATRDRRPNAAKIALFTRGRHASEFAKWAGFSRTHTYDCLNGRERPSARFKSKLAEFLGVPVESIFPEDAP